MATPKKPTPKVKITGSASGRVATGTKSVTRGASMAQSPKLVDRKPAVKKPVVPAKPKLESKTISRKIGEAYTASKKANKRVENDKWPGAYQEQRNKSAIKAKNVRKALDVGKTAMRAKIIDARMTKDFAKNFPGLKDEAKAAKAMAKAKKK